MKFIYMDPGLSAKTDSNADFCRRLNGMAAKANIPFRALGHRSLVKDLREELGAIPCFRHRTCWDTDNDPVCGWLNAFQISSDDTEDDLKNISGIDAGDIVYVHSVHPQQLLAVSQWADKPGAGKPVVVASVCDDVGLSVDANGLIEKITGPEGILWRHVASRMKAPELSPINLISYGMNTSRIYRSVLRQNVTTLSDPETVEGKKGCDEILRYRNDSTNNIVINMIEFFK